MKRKMKISVIVVGLAIAILFIKNVLAAYFNRIDPVGKLYWLESNDQYDPEWELMVCDLATQTTTPVAKLEKGYGYVLLQTDLPEIYLSKGTENGSICMLEVSQDGTIKESDKMETDLKIVQILARYQDRVYFIAVVGYQGETEERSTRLIRFGEYNVKTKKTKLIGEAFLGWDLMNTPTVSQDGKILYVRARKHAYIDEEGKQRVAYYQVCMAEGDSEKVLATGDRCVWYSDEEVLVKKTNERWGKVNVQTGEVSELEESTDDTSLAMGNSSSQAMVLSADKRYIAYSAAKKSKWDIYPEVSETTCLRVRDIKTGKERVVAEENSSLNWISGRTLLWR